MRPLSAGWPRATPDHALRLIRLFVVTLRLAVALRRRYALNFAGQALAVLAVFVLLWSGVRIGQDKFAWAGDGTATMIVNFMVFTAAMTAFSRVSIEIVRDSMQGTLEGFALSPLGLTSVLLVRTLANMLLDIAFCVVSVCVMMLISGVWLPLRLHYVIPLLVITVMGVQGFGLMLGGLALVYKQVSSLFVFCQFALLGLIIASREQQWLALYLPLSGGARVIRSVMIEGSHAGDFSAPMIVGVALNSAAYLAIGLLVLRRFEEAARNRGILGHY